MGGMGGGMGGGGGQGMGGGMGGMGGGMGMGGGGMGMGGGMGGGGMGGGFFNVPAEKVGRFRVPCVCLEHGKPEPRPAIPYQIKPIESFSTNPQLASMLTMFGKGQLDQRAVQAAAWHIANEMSWEELANKVEEIPGGQSEPYFSQEEIQRAYQIAQMAQQEAEKNPRKPGAEKTEKSPGEIAAERDAAGKGG